MSNKYGDNPEPQVYDIIKVISKTIRAEHSMPMNLYQFISEIKAIANKETPKQSLAPWMGRWTFPFTLNF